jgi:nucleoside-diphosphate-sugar epimerase
MSNKDSFYSGKRVLVTGGFGFLGLNLISRLAENGAVVRVLYHGSANASSHRTRFLEGIEPLHGDIRDSDAVRRALDGCEVVFNFAGRSGAVASNSSPFEDLDTNVRGQLIFLQACSEVKTLKVVFPSSRLVYKPTADLPVNESAATGPISIYGVHKLAAEHYHLLYDRLGLIDAVVLRITNPYGPFQRREQNRYGIVNWFIHRALNGLDLPVYGLGDQIRDYVHVDDVVNAFLRAGATPAGNGMTLNIGSGSGVSFSHMAELVIQAAGMGTIRFIEWPSDAAGVETGDFVADVSLVENVLGWRPRVTIDQGVEDVVAKYRATAVD